MILFISFLGVLNIIVRSPCGSVFCSFFCTTSLLILLSSYTSHTEDDETMKDQVGAIRSSLDWVE